MINHYNNNKMKMIQKVKLIKKLMKLYKKMILLKCKIKNFINNLVNFNKLRKQNSIL